jgi:HD-GYP domain-containing protein (c-di-GMP phosphodiesterase class II)
MSPAIGAAGSMARPPDQRFRELGLQLVLRLSGVIRIGRSYQVNNQVFREQLETFIAAVNAILDESDEAVLVALDTDLYLNGFRIPIRPANVRFHQYVLDEFKLRQIAGIRLEKGAEREEITKFFELFMRPDDYSGTSLLEACVAHGLNRVQPAVHASASSPDEGFTPFDVDVDEVEGEKGGEEGPGAFTDHDPTRVGPGRAGQAPRGAARKSYWMAMAGARSLLAPTSIQEDDRRGIEMRHAKRVVQPLVDGAFQGEPVLVGLTTLGSHDEFTYAHAVNVTMVAVTIGHFLGLERRALADLGVAALLHDVGKNAVANAIKNSIEEFTPEEKTAAERHPIEGVKILAQATSMNLSSLRCMRASLEHHLGLEGRGYPKLRDWSPSVLSQVISVADCYVSLQTYRSRHGANVTPYQALGMVLGPLRAHFEPALLWALTQAVGFYPPGQLVELDDGRIAVVLRPNRDDLAKPHLRVVARLDRRRMAPEERVEYNPLPPGIAITRALKAEEYPEDPEETGEDAA